MFFKFLFCVMLSVHFSKASITDYFLDENERRLERFAHAKNAISKVNSLEECGSLKSAYNRAITYESFEFNGGDYERGMWLDCYNDEINGTCTFGIEETLNALDEGLLSYVIFRNDIQLFTAQMSFHDKQTPVLIHFTSEVNKQRLENLMRLGQVDYCVPLVRFISLGYHVQGIKIFRLTELSTIMRMNMIDTLGGRPKPYNFTSETINCPNQKTAARNPENETETINISYDTPSSNFTESVLTVLNVMTCIFVIVIIILIKFNVLT